MNTLIETYWRLDRLQNGKKFKVASSVVVVLMGIGVMVGVLSGSLNPRLSFLSANNVLALIGTTALLIAWGMLVVWMGLTITYLLIAIGTAMLTGLLLMVGLPGLALAVGGMGTLSFTFLLLIQLLLLIYGHPNQIFSVAHTVIKESVRLRISVFFIVALLVLLPLLPLIVGSEQALRYRIQSFISYSTGATFYLAATMTVLLACGTVAFEIRDRQIWQLMTKPVSRLNYLIGKWVGIASVNFVILIVTGLSIFMFVQYMAGLQPADRLDAEAVRNEVLVARDGAYVRFEAIPRDVLVERVSREIDNNFTLLTEIENGIRRRPDIEREIALRLRDEHSLAQRTVDVAEMKDFTFAGLSGAKQLGYPLRLRFRFHYYADDTHENIPVVFFVKKDQKLTGAPKITDFVPTISKFVDFTADDIGDDGTLTIALVNGRITTDGQVFPGTAEPYSLNFDPEDLEILYTVGGFEANYFRAMLVMWVKLAFLTMVGLAAATALSFPVATLTTFTVLLAGVIVPFLSEALQNFAVPSAARVDRVLIKAVAVGLVFVFQPFGQINPTQSLIEGRVIPWLSVLKALGLLGGVWTGLALVIGFLSFKDRELATYSGHG